LLPRGVDGVPRSWRCDSIDRAHGRQCLAVRPSDDEIVYLGMDMSTVRVNIDRVQIAALDRGRQQS
jgi:hypothetical protein